jgi:hypothetical protein
VHGDLLTNKQTSASKYYRRHTLKLLLFVPTASCTHIHSIMHNVTIWYAPPPDGEDCSATYASRASGLLSSSSSCSSSSVGDGDGDGAEAEADVVNMNVNVKVQIAPLNPDDSLWDCDHNDVDDDGGQAMGSKAQTDLHLFLISCAADGSVHRSVRKLTRKLLSLSSSKHKKNDDHNDSAQAAQGDDSTSTSNSTSGCCCQFAVALLGHARCETSAAQMADTIFGTGRRFEKALSTSTNPVFTNITPQQRRLEEQVELCGPEIAFDPWVLKQLVM